MQTFQFLSYPIDFNPLSYSYMCCNSTFKFQPQSSSRGKIRVQGWKWIARMANILAINKTKTKAVSNSKQNFRFETRVFLLTLTSLEMSGLFSREARISEHYMHLTHCENAVVLHLSLKIYG